MSITLPPSLAARDRDTIAAVVAQLRSRWPVERVVLFGSKARGDDDEDSDIDLLIITPHTVDRETENAMDDAAWETGLEHGRCVLLVFRYHVRRDNGIDQATVLRLQFDQDCREVFRP